MAVFKSLISAFSTYSTIPMPQVNYKEGDGRYTIIFFPFIGIVIACIEFLWMNLGWYAGFPEYSLNIGFILIPIIITGGIHVDGFMDVMDAIHSYGDSSKRLEILGDPHVGAFAVIKLLELVGIWLIALSIIDYDFWLLAALGFIASRILSGISIMKLPLAKSQGMLFYTKEHADKVCINVLIIEFTLLSMTIIYYYGLNGLAPIMASVICYFIYKFKVKRDFGGATGDTAGCFLCMTETAWIIMTAFLFL